MFTSLKIDLDGHFHYFATANLHKYLWLMLLQPH